MRQARVATWGTDPPRLRDRNRDRGFADLAVGVRADPFPGWYDLVRFAGACNTTVDGLFGQNVPYGGPGRSFAWSER